VHGNAERPRYDPAVLALPVPVRLLILAICHTLMLRASAEQANPRKALRVVQCLHRATTGP